jgi:hypothetical protein
MQISWLFTPTILKLQRIKCHLLQLSLGEGPDVDAALVPLVKGCVIQLCKVHF